MFARMEKIPAKKGIFCSITIEYICDNRMLKNWYRITVKNVRVYTDTIGPIDS